MANPQYQEWIDANPFEGLIINADGILNELEGRHTCTKCGKSRKYFCYTCYVPINELEGLLPSIQLPFKIDIIKHKQEVNGKSTSAHAAVLASADVTIYTYPNLPDYSQESNVVLIFPSFDAIAVSDLFTTFKSVNEVELPKGYHKTTLMTQKRRLLNLNEVLNSHTVLPISKAVFIDSTWNQSRGIFKDEKLKNLQCIMLQNRISQFWRHQKDSPRWYLSTVEAIHQFLIEVHLNMWGVDPKYKGLPTCFSDYKYYTNLLQKSKPGDDNLYNGQYDNLLFFFKHMYKVIHTYHGHEQLYAYKRRLI